LYEKRAVCPIFFKSLFAVRYGGAKDLVILAIDTTSESASIALVDVGQAILSPAKCAENVTVIEEVLLESPDGFAHVLFDEIDRLLSRHNLAIGQIDGFAVAAGPGSFTGVRVGLTAAKGLAEATGRKVVAVSNLQALASLGTLPLRAVVIDARRGEIYGAVYDAQLNPVRGELVIKYDDWLRTLSTGDPKFDLEFITAGFPITGAGNARVTQAPRALAGAVGKIAASRFAAGLAEAPSAIDANYVRRSDAEVSWKDIGPALAWHE
jgi:tRNA threonylcarbamoyladenosine biosynthesis protein TsaB